MLNILFTYLLLSVQSYHYYLLASSAALARHNPYFERTRTNAMTLCFGQAFLRKSEITEKEYISHLLAHFQGLRHPQDSENDEGAIIEKLDPFGASVREVALKPGYKPFQDTQPYQKLLEDCITNNVDQIKLDLPKIIEQHPISSPLQPLAVLAARKGHAEILQFCLDKGAVLDWNLERSIHFGNNSPAMDNILFAEKQKLPGRTSAKSDSKWDGELLQKWFRDIDW